MAGDAKRRAPIGRADRSADEGEVFEFDARISCTFYDVDVERFMFICIEELEPTFYQQRRHRLC